MHCFSLSAKKRLLLIFEYLIHQGVYRTCHNQVDVSLIFIAIPYVLHIGIDRWIYSIEILELINKKVDMLSLRQFHDEFEYSSKRHSLAVKHWYAQLCANLINEYVA